VGFVGLACCVALALVLAVSGVAKLMDRYGTSEAVLGFGVRSGLVPFVAGGLAPAELVTAALVLVPGTRALGLLVATLLLLAFTAVVVLSLRAGRRPECHCFGRIGGADVSGRTVARNLTLLLVAVVGLAGTAGDEAPEGAAAFGAAVVGLAVAAAVLAAEGLAGAAARERRVTEDEAAFEAVSERVVPRFRAETVGGGRTSLDELLAPGLPLLLVSLSPGCGPCKKLRPDVASWAEIFRERLTVAVLASGPREHNLAAYTDVPGLIVVLDEQNVRTQLGIGSAPAAVVVTPDGHLASGVAGGEDLIRRLVVSTVTGTDSADAAPSAERTARDGIDADGLDLASVLSPLPGVQRHPLGGSTVLLDPSTGATVALDQVGSLVWSVLDGTAPLRDIVADLAEVYGVAPDVVGPDVLGLARALGRAGLLDGVRPGQRQPAWGNHDQDDHDHGDQQAGSGHGDPGVAGPGGEEQVASG
jgi:hypothetical protein